MKRKNKHETILPMNANIKAKIRYELENPFYRVLIVILAVFAMMSFFLGCKSAKQIEKEVVRTHTISEDSARKLEEINKRTAKTLTDTYTGNYTIPERVNEGSQPLNDVLSGHNLVLEDERQKTEVKYDAATKSLKVVSTTKKADIPITGTKTINEVTEETAKRDSSGVSHKSTDQEKIAKKRDVKRTNYAPLGGFVALVVIIVLVIIFRKKIPILKNFC